MEVFFGPSLPELAEAQIARLGDKPLSAKPSRDESIDTFRVQRKALEPNQH
jgi:hypothetical protein